MKKKLNIKETGFKTPKNYFDEVEDHVFSQLKLDEALGGEKHSGFEVPHNYFSSVEDEVLKTVKAQDNKVISLFSSKNLLYVSGMAAAIVILFGIFMKSDGNTELILDAEMAETYLLQQDISTYELASLLTEEDLESLNSDIMNEAFIDDEMEDYLLENVDLEDIIEQ